jgi:hypothetical protein
MQGKIMTKVGNRVFDNVAHIKYFGTVIIQNLIQEEIKRLEFRQCFSPENLFSHVLFKNVKRHLVSEIKVRKYTEGV